MRGPRTKEHEKKRNLNDSHAFLRLSPIPSALCACALPGRECAKSHRKLACRPPYRPPVCLAAQPPTIWDRTGIVFLVRSKRSRPVDDCVTKHNQLIIHSFFVLEMRGLRLNCTVPSTLYCPLQHVIERSALKRKEENNLLVFMFCDHASSFHNLKKKDNLRSAHVFCIEHLTTHFGECFCEEASFAPKSTNSNQSRCIIVN